MKRVIKPLAIVITMLFIGSVHAWSGYNADTGEAIEVESYDHRGIGEGEVEYYAGNGDHRTGYLDMYPGGSGTITDSETGEIFDVDMD